MLIQIPSWIPSQFQLVPNKFFNVYKVLSFFKIKMNPLLPLGGDSCPYFAPFLGFAGAGSAMIFSAIGAAFGTAKSGIGFARF